MNTLFYNCLRSIRRHVNNNEYEIQENNQVKTRYGTITIPEDIFWVVKDYSVRLIYTYPNCRGITFDLWYYTAINKPYIVKYLFEMNPDCKKLWNNNNPLHNHIILLNDYYYSFDQNLIDGQYRFVGHPHNTYSMLTECGRLQYIELGTILIDHYEIDINKCTDKYRASIDKIKNCPELYEMLKNKYKDKIS